MVVLVEVLVVERVEGGFKRDAINITSLTDNLVHIVLPINHEAVGVQLNQVIDEHDNRHIKSELHAVNSDNHIMFRGLADIAHTVSLSMQGVETVM